MNMMVRAVFRPEAELCALKKSPKRWKKCILLDELFPCYR